MLSRTSGACVNHWHAPFAHLQTQAARICRRAPRTAPARSPPGPRRESPTNRAACTSAYAARHLRVKASPGRARLRSRLHLRPACHVWLWNLRRFPVADTQGRTQSATGGDPSRLEKAGRSRICLSDNGKILKADCGFGLDHSKSSDALLLRCSDAEVGQDRAAVLTDRVTD